MLESLLAAAVHAAGAADSETSAGLQQWPRRALLQSTPSPVDQLQQEAQKANKKDSQPGFSIHHLLIFAALMVGLTFCIILIGCLSFRFRQWVPSDGTNRGAFVRRHAVPEPPVLVQDVKLRELPMLVIMPGNEITYAHKLGPEDDCLPPLKPARKVVDEPECPPSGGGGGATSAAAAAAAAAPSDSALLDADATAAAARGSAEAAASVGVESATGDAAAAVPPLGRRSARVRAERWSGRSMNAAEVHALRQAERVEERAQALAQATQPAQPQVRVIPAFIEWDITSDEGPIFHPPPALEPRPETRAAQLAAEASLAARANSSGSGGFLRSSSRGSNGIPRVASAGSDLDASGNGAGAAGGPNLSARSASLAEMWRTGIAWRPALTHSAASGNGAGSREASHHGANNSAHGSPPGSRLDGGGGSGVRAVSMDSPGGSGRRSGGGSRPQVFPDSDYFNRQLFG